jgi:putative FmdB family regulatory protein
MRLESCCRKLRPVRALLRVTATADYRLESVPLFEFRCRACDARFEELVGSHVGTALEDVSCPACGSRDLERLEAAGFASIHRQLTPAQKRRMEDERGTDRGGARERFGRQRDAERARAGKERGR